METVELVAAPPQGAASDQNDGPHAVLRYVYPGNSRSAEVILAAYNTHGPWTPQTRIVFTTAVIQAFGYYVTIDILGWRIRRADGRTIALLEFHPMATPSEVARAFRPDVPAPTEPPSKTPNGPTLEAQPCQSPLTSPPSTDSSISDGHYSPTPSQPPTAGTSTGARPGTPASTAPATSCGPWIV